MADPTPPASTPASGSGDRLSAAEVLAKLEVRWMKAALSGDYSELTEEELRLPPRRLDVRLPSGVRIAFSVPAGVQPSRTVEAVIRAQRQVAFGHAPRVVRIDGPPSGTIARLRWAWAVSIMHALAFAHRLRSNIVDRPAIERRLAEDAAALRAAASQSAGGAA